MKGFQGQHRLQKGRLGTVCSPILGEGLDKNQAQNKSKICKYSTTQRLILIGIVYIYIYRYGDIHIFF